jgi:ELWxxDGT repeat protein
MIHGWMRNRSAHTTPRNTRRARLGVEVLEDRTLPSVSMLPDINQTTAPAFPAGSVLSSVQLDGFVYFSADDGRHANALWRTDGTAKGTTLVKVIDTGGDPATAMTLSHLTVLNHHLLFTVNDGVHGDEPWISNGTPGGTHLLLDIHKSDPGTGFSDSFASDFVVIGTRAYFTADDGTHGRELWKTDGTADGTYMLRDIDPFNSQPDNLGPSTDGPQSLTAFQGKLYFFGNDGVHGRELWVSDGTKEGTHMVKDINSGPGDSEPQVFSYPESSPSSSLVVAGNSLYFAADDGKDGVELWKTDGTTKGTQLVKDIFPGINSSAWPTPQPNSSSPQSLTSVNGVLYFTADDGVHGRQLWTSDGAAKGTHLVSAANGIPSLVDPQNLTAAGKQLFFSVNSDMGAEVLWVTDGTAKGTHSTQTLIAPHAPITYPLPVFGSSQDFFSLDGRLYYTAVDAAHGRELWQTDGSKTGTHLFKDIRSGPAGSEISFMTSLNHDLLLVANDGTHGRELWISDGTDMGTLLVKDINTHEADASPSAPVQIGKILYFSADDGIHGQELWRSDGTPQGTRMVKDINPGFTPSWLGEDSVPADSNIHDMVTMDGLLYFAADDGVHGDELWRSDGTAAGTRMVKDINTSPPQPILWAAASTTSNGGANISELTVMIHHLYFAADDGVHGRELWTSDGTSTGTHMVIDLNTSSNGLPIVAGSSNASSDPGNLTVYNGKLYFAADDGVHGRELWATGGTAATTHLVKNISPDPGGIQPGQGSFPDNLTVAGSYLYFTADDGSHGVELWRTDGTQPGTRMVRDLNTTTSRPPWAIHPIPGSSNPYNLTAVGDLLYFVADDGVNGPALWKTNGWNSGTSLVRAFQPSTQFGPAYLGDLTAVGNQIFFTVDTPQAGNELWVSNGTHAGTHLVKDIFPGSGPNLFGPGQIPNSSSPTALTAFQGQLYFIADDGIHGRELWSSNGTALGTTLVADVFHGPGSGFSWTSGLKALGNTLYFSATDGQHGQELWQFRMS